MNLLRLTTGCLFILLPLLPAFSDYQDNEAREIVRKADENMRGKTSQSDVSIVIVRPTWSREMNVKTWTMGTTYAMILLAAPAREKGIVFLKRGKEVWNWVPSIERMIKLPPSMMSQSWMGTDFTNDDLVKEASVIDDYTHRLLGEETIDGNVCYRIEMIPKPSTAVVWGKINVWIDKKNYLELRADFYDEEGELVNVMHAGEPRHMNGRLITTKMEMVPADKKGYKTILRYNNIVFDKPMSEDFFSTQYIKKVK